LAGPKLSASPRRATGSSAIPTGTLTQKIHCHELLSMIAPPTSGPMATARPPMPDQMPSASPRLSAGNAALSSVSVSGATIAPPSPWIARAAISASVEGASAANADAPVKIAIPMRNILRRPNRSPSAAPVSRKTANASV
jgi:hypothetical protein